MKVLFAATAPVTLERFMEGQLAFIAGQGHEVHVVSSPGPDLETVGSREGVQVHAVPMSRDVSPLQDAVALVGWVRVLVSVRPDVVVVSTPKAGLLGGIAARICRIRRRVYLLRGARYESTSGPQRRVLLAMERWSCRNAHRVIAVSPSLAKRVIEDQVVEAGKITTVGCGSSNGVDQRRFHPADARERAEARSLYGLDGSEVAVVYVGRLHPDKGLQVLKDAVGSLAAVAEARVVILLAGPPEGSRLDAVEGVDVRYLGYVHDVPALMHAADVLVLPTQREGFPNVVLEAAASGVPVVTTDATGAVDSVVDGVTGFVVGKQDGEAMGAALGRLVNSADLREVMGAEARRRVERGFDQGRIWTAMLHAYLSA